MLDDDENEEEELDDYEGGARKGASTSNHYNDSSEEDEEEDDDEEAARAVSHAVIESPQFSLLTDSPPARFAKVSSSTKMKSSKSARSGDGKRRNVGGKNGSARMSI